MAQHQFDDEHAHIHPSRGRPASLLYQAHMAAATSSMSSVSYIMQSAVRTTSNRELARSREENNFYDFLTADNDKRSFHSSSETLCCRARRTGSH